MKMNLWQEEGGWEGGGWSLKVIGVLRKIKRTRSPKSFLRSIQISDWDIYQMEKEIPLQASNIVRSSRVFSKEEVDKAKDGRKM